MQIEGTVFAGDGRPAPGVIVYAYHTDSRGIYPTAKSARGHPAIRHGLLRNWVMTDDKGHYRFDTIRPAGYPNSDIPAHVHMHVIEVGRCTYYIDDIVFEDDPRLSAGRTGGPGDRRVERRAAPGAGRRRIGRTLRGYRRVDDG